MAPRWTGAAGFFEIWFAVVFDRAQSRAWWLRWTTFASATGETRATIWAAAFEAGRPSCAGKTFVAVDDVRAAAAALAEGATSGRVETDAGPLVWELAFHGGDAPVRGPAWLERVPAPTRVAHVRGEARVTGTVRLGDGPARRVDGVGAVKHIWGTRRVEELFWLYCPLLEDGGAIEATAVRVRRDRGPRIAPVWLRARGIENGWWRTPGLFRQRLVPDRPGRLRVRAVSGTACVVATATCDPATLVGWVYRDPSGFDVYVAQSDVATCEVAWCDRRHRLARWSAPRHARGARAAIEFHERTPLPGVRYVPWDATTAEGGEPCRPAM